MLLRRNTPQAAAAPATHKPKWQRPTPIATSAASTTAAPDLPSFEGLSERESLFVVEYASRSGTRGAGADAALAAGFSNGNRDAAHSMASKLLRRPHVLRALKDETGRKIAAAAPVGVAVLAYLAINARSEQVRLSAANSLVDRGYGVPMSRNANLNLNATTTVEQLLDKLDRQEGHGARSGAPPIVDVTPSGRRDG
jgi:phage terminase small subunit